ncbi:periplasmic heavy metal sensor [Aliiruegeria lutimaris]|uniref:Protein refolding chaperone Spy/CpxP family n=1 Tax=Aliiruegeria lutimaris TaxID=571298 RepID=A0A1G8LN88_9RHOB|nr:periplasmic heavy metal sensor [Aliiruegeria lutimaris]SDI56907.1 protein refolding chaperone Spy/CpxP family [Aliiruegeria lutimaris]
MRLLVIAALCAASPLLAQDAPYAGQQERTISSFSEADIASIEAGEGWGLALPAELNGWPGPAHVLEMADALSLDTEQRSQIETIFDEMKMAAKSEGRRMLDAEAALDAAFRSGEIDPERLVKLLAAAEAARAALRQVHLGAHLRTAPFLTPHQKMLYSQARGYQGGAGFDHSAHGGSH